MRKLLRKGLDAYEGRHEKRDEELAEVVSHHLDAMSDRRTLLRYILVLAVVDALIWLSAVIFPRDLREAWATVTGVGDRIGAVIIAVLFGIGLWLTYSLLRLKFPKIEEQALESEVFASATYDDKASKKFRIWLLAVVGGIVNAIGPVLVVIALSGE